MTNNPTLPKGIFEACNKFYRAFDHMPSQIYVNWHRKVHLPPYVNVPVILTALQMVSMIAENDPSPNASFVSVPFVAEDWKDSLRYSTKTGSFVRSGLEWEDFALYSAKTGRVKPEDLQPSAELIKRIIEARGYKVLVNREHPAMDIFYIFEGDRYISFAFSKIDYTAPYSPIDAIKAEIDYTLKKFLT